MNLSERLDPYFETIGLDSEVFAMRGSRYRGVFHGRQVEVTCSPRTLSSNSRVSRRRRYIGHRFSVQIMTATATRLNFFPRRHATWLTRLLARTNRWFGLAPMTELHPAYDHLEIWALDTVWARRYLEIEPVRDAVLRLLPPDDWDITAEIQNLWMQFQPDRIWFSQRLRLQSLSPERAQYWMEALATIAGETDNAAPPMQPARLYWHERFARERPRLFGCAVVAALLVCLTAPALCLVALALLLGN